MEKILLNLNILNKHYTVYQNEKTSQLNAYSFDKISRKLEFLKNEKEIKILNGIIRKLNLKYIYKGNVIFNNEEFIRYQNKYSQLSFFANNKNTLPISFCPYKDYKELYNLYNGKTVSYYNRKPYRIDPNSNIPPRNISQYSGSNQYYNRNELRPKKNNIVKKIVLAIAGITISVGLTASAYKMLSNGDIPNVFEREDSISTETTEIVPGKKIELKAPYNEDSTIPTSNEDQLLKDKYETIANQLREAGLSNWEIAYELDVLSLFSDDQNNIDFYYDSEKDEIIYLFDELGKNNTLNTEKEMFTVPDEVQRVLNAIDNNENLSDKEKEYILNTYTNVLSKNADYINPYELENRYRALKINYDYQEDGGDVNESYSPYTKAAGNYTHKGILATGELDVSLYTTSEINLFDSHSIEETLTSDSKKATLGHELNHVNGAFSYYEPASLLNEGYTQLSQPDGDTRYIKEQAMAILFIQTFGDNTLKEGYYGFDLQNALTNKIVSSTSKSNDEVSDEVVNLLADTEKVLYILGSNPNFKNDFSAMDQLNSLFEKLSNYYEVINGKKFEDNQICASLKDYLLGSRNAKIYNSESESITGFSYNIDDNAFKIQISAEHGKISFSTDPGIINKLSEGISIRNLTIDNSNKYNEKFPVKDEDIDFITR